MSLRNWMNVQGTLLKLIILVKKPQHELPGYCVLNVNVTLLVLWSPFFPPHRYLHCHGHLPAYDPDMWDGNIWCIQGNFKWNCLNAYWTPCAFSTVCFISVHLPLDTNAHSIFIFLRHRYVIVCSWMVVCLLVLLSTDSSVLIDILNSIHF